MRLRVLLGVALLAVMLLAVSCGRTYFRYVPGAEIPRMVYMSEESIVNMGTIQGRMYAGDVYVRVTTRDGKTRTGKLLRIDEGELLMTPTYYYDSDGESVTKIDVETVISKDQIIILKIY